MTEDTGNMIVYKDNEWREDRYERHLQRLERAYRARNPVNNWRYYSFVAISAFLVGTLSVFLFASVARIQTLNNTTELR
jgi:hypothetical protein